MSRRYDLAAVGRGLRLWSCAVGDPGEIGDHWVLLWARDEQRARALALDLRGERGDEPEHVYVTEADSDGARPLGAEPHEETRDRVKRAAGWGVEDGWACDWCGLDDLDEDQWHVCRECGVCWGCGHDPDPEGNCASEDFARAPGEAPLLPVLWRTEQDRQFLGWALAWIALGGFGPAAGRSIVAEQIVAEQIELLRVSQAVEVIA